MKLRIKFRKYGCLKFIGHLDVMRYFQKLMRRAEIDIAYTEGFSPHQIMSFASPLGVGLLSNAEYMDIEVKSVTDSADMKDRMNRHSVEGIEIMSVRMLPEKAMNAMASVQYADYSLRVREGYSVPFDLNSAVSAFYDRPEILVTKATKKSTREVDLKESVKIMKMKEDAVFMRVLAGSGENIKPELVLKALYDFKNAEYDDFTFEITREELYDEKVRSLESAGTVF